VLNVLKYGYSTKSALALNYDHIKHICKQRCIS